MGFGYECLCLHSKTGESLEGLDLVPLLSLVLEEMNLGASCFIPVINIHMTFQLVELLEISSS